MLDLLDTGHADAVLARLKDLKNGNYTAVQPSTMATAETSGARRNVKSDVFHAPSHGSLFRLPDKGNGG